MPGGGKGEGMRLTVMRMRWWSELEDKEDDDITLEPVSSGHDHMSEKTYLD